jgi:hypothetical protein
MTLLLAFVVAWSALNTFGIAGLAVAAVLLGVAAYIRTAEDIGRAIKNLLMLALILACIALFIPVRSRAREPARRTVCNNQLKQIALALHNYHVLYGSFPPAYVPGPDGKPWHSWRVLILPFIEQESLYEEYDFSEPWDGPNNSKLAGWKPQEYWCPSDADSYKTPTTNYAAVVGPRAAWSGSEPRTLGDFADGADSTIIIVEVAGSGIHWMEPRDLSFDEARRGIGPPGPGRISSYHPFPSNPTEPDAQVAMADSSVRLLPGRIEQPTLEALLAIDENPQLDWTAIPLAPSRLKPAWSRIFPPVVLLVSYLILLLRPRKRREAEPQGARPCDSA